MELKEMIEVMTHYLNGGEVEFKRTIEDDTKWEKLLPVPVWNWERFDYRIKEENQKVTKVTIEKWLMQSTIDKEYRIIETSLVDKVVNFKKVKLMEIYEVEL